MVRFQQDPPINERTDMNILRARFSQFHFDAYNPSNIETMFEFLYLFDEVVLPNGNKYRINNEKLEIFDNTWNISTLSVNDLLDIVKGMMPEDWLYVRKNSIKRNIFHLSI